MDEEKKLNDLFFYNHYKNIAETYLENIFFNGDLVKVGKYYLFPDIILNNVRRPRAEKEYRDKNFSIGYSFNAVRINKNNKNIILL